MLQCDSVRVSEFDSVTVWQFTSLTVWQFDSLTVWQCDSETAWKFDSVTRDWLTDCQPAVWHDTLYGLAEVSRLKCHLPHSLVSTVATGAPQGQKALLPVCCNVSVVVIHSITQYQQSLPCTLLPDYKNLPTRSFLGAHFNKGFCCNWDHWNLLFLVVLLKFLFTFFYFICWPGTTKISNPPTVME